MIIGHIDEILDGFVFGWMYSSDEGSKPYLTVNDAPCELIASDITREDVSKELNVDHKVGFSFKLTQNLKGSAYLKLYGISELGLFEVAEKTIVIDFNGEDSQLAHVHNSHEISNKENAVAVVVWEGAHNPIGRAKVLYDILINNDRPTIIFAFDFGEFGQGLWGPLRESNIEVVLIPWREREFYFQYILSLGINFSTVWICKPRKPSFELASIISNEKTKVILDIDDDESVMSASGSTSVRHYGKVGYDYSEPIISQLNSLSVASISLQERFGGEIVRHARSHNLSKKKTAERYIKGYINIGFIGTVRPHKNLTDAARNINILNKLGKQKLQLIVGGHYYPAEVRNELDELGVVTLGQINQTSLPSCLSKLDIILVGFPNAYDDEIAKYQISSKIGDGLAAGKPVMVPYSESIKDLEGVPGIYLFDLHNFHDVLTEIIRDISKRFQNFALPKDFTYSGAYSVFKRLEERAPPGQLFDLLKRQMTPSIFNPKKTYSVKGKRNLLLFWKQHDAGLYGRRVDQLARSYALFYPECNVHVLEIVSNSQFDGYKKSYIDLTKDSELIIKLYNKKCSGYYDNNVKYQMISTDDYHSVQEKLKNYFLEHNCYPSNTVAALFPIVPNYPEVIKALRGYPLVADFVDNQLSWPSKNKVEIMSFYKDLIDRADCITFNSAVNKEFFVDSKFISPEDSHVSIIENWYRLPSDLEVVESKEDGEFINLLYSGNMNDRFDWALLESLLIALPVNFQVHLVGNANRVWEKLSQLLSYDNIKYHGPMSEKQLIRFAGDCDIGIMPHLDDGWSRYMNPLKIEMYREIGLPVVTTNVLGIDSKSALVHVADAKSFTQKIIALAQDLSRDNFCRESKLSLSPYKKEILYFDLIDSLFKEYEL